MNYGMLLASIFLALTSAANTEEHQAVFEFKKENSNWVEISTRKEFSVTLSYFVAKAEGEYRVLVFREGQNRKPPLIWQVNYEEARALAYLHSQRAYQQLTKLLAAPPKKATGLGGTWVWIDGGEANTHPGKIKFWLEGTDPEMRKLVVKVLDHLSKLTGVSLIADFRVHYPDKGAEDGAENNEDPHVFFARRFSDRCIRALWGGA